MVKDLNIFVIDQSLFFTSLLSDVYIFELLKKKLTFIYTSTLVQLNKHHLTHF